jgi:hypothetical protein
MAVIEPILVSGEMLEKKNKMEGCELLLFLTQRGGATYDSASLYCLIQCLLPLEINLILLPPMPVVAPAIVINDIQSAHAIIWANITAINNGGRIIYNRSWSIGNRLRSINRRWLVLRFRLSLRLLLARLRGWLYYYRNTTVFHATLRRTVVCDRIRLPHAQRCYPRCIYVLNHQGILYRIRTLLR